MVRTIDELAELSGVSRATVSRVLNGGSVSEKTRLRVEAVLGETNYRPNLAARSLASGRSSVVGVVMHVDPHLLFEDPYFSQLMQGMSTALADRSAGMMLWLGNRSKEETLGTILSMGLLDGVVVTANGLDDPARRRPAGVRASDGAGRASQGGQDRELRGRRQRPRSGRDDDPPHLDRPLPRRVHHWARLATWPRSTGWPATAGPCTAPG